MIETLLPISAVIPTCERAATLKRTLDSIALQGVQPSEIVIIDSSTNNKTYKLCHTLISGLESSIIYEQAKAKGAASQRNQGVDTSRYPFILFMDDDIFLEADCIKYLWEAIKIDSSIGGVNALITNQQYKFPGFISRFVYKIIDDQNSFGKYQGKVIGPAVGFLAHETNQEPLIEAQWLNLGLTLYRKESLPKPAFENYFKGYSFMEDLTLSSIVNKKWKLYTVRDARIYHDSQPGVYKSNVYELGKMQTQNRYFVMTSILGKTNFRAHLSFYFFCLFTILASFNSKRPFKSKLLYSTAVLGYLFSFKKVTNEII